MKSPIVRQEQANKAVTFRQQHHKAELLILPNIWDVLSAKLIEALGFPSVATASVATALTNGYADGENIPFATLLKVVKQITVAVSVPVTVDIERGFAGNIEQLKENIELLIENGAIGVNIEDGRPDKAGLAPIDEQCRKIEAVRETGMKYGVPIVINARTDIFLQKASGDQVLQQAITRIRAFKEAGADCAYPILINNYQDIAILVEETQMPVNVFLLQSIGDLKKLESIGVSRVSTGPGLLKGALANMKNVAEGLQNYHAEAFLGQDLLTNDFLKNLL